MTRREKLLAGAVGLMGVMLVGSSLLTRYQEAVEDNRTELRETELKLSQARTAKLRGQRAVTKLRRWQKQSLPTNPDIANSLYQDWLQKQLTDSGLKVSDIKSSAGLRAANDRFQEFTFTVEAAGDRSALVKFLTGFYEAGHLHRISRATLARAKEGSDLSVSLTVNALAMRDADRADKLSEIASKVELPPAEQIEDAITTRNPFAPFEDKAVNATASKKPANEADQAYVTGMIQGESGWRLSIRMKDSGRVLYFQTGDAIDIGSFKAKVGEINGRRVLLEKDGSSMQVFLGQTLGQAQPYAGT